VTKHCTYPNIRRRATVQPCDSTWMLHAVEKTAQHPAALSPSRAQIALRYVCQSVTMNFFDAAQICMAVSCTCSDFCSESPAAAGPVDCLQAVPHHDGINTQQLCLQMHGYHSTVVQSKSPASWDPQEHGTCVGVQACPSLRTLNSNANQPSAAVQAPTAIAGRKSGVGRRCPLALRPSGSLAPATLLW
jgi:hypothetical protein